MTTRSPAPRVGDVITVAPGATPEYRGAFRLRVTEILTRGGRQRLDCPIVGGVVVNADGRDRLTRGGVQVERSLWLTEAARSLVTAVEPAPPTWAELRDAHAEHDAREIRRTRCDHVPITLGCTHVQCPGVPPVDGATVVEPDASDAPTPAEYGTQIWARDLRDALRRYPTITDVTMPRVTCTPDGARTVRRYMVASAQVDGHAVSVITWESAGYAQMTAITVDGALIDPDVTNSRAATSAERAHMVAWRVADALRDAAPVAQVDAPAQVEPSADAPAPVAQVEPAPVATGAPVAVRTVNPAWPNRPHATCPECGKVVAIRADGRSLFTHNRLPRQQCPLSRERIDLGDASAPETAPVPVPAPTRTVETESTMSETVSAPAAVAQVEPAPVDVSAPAPVAPSGRFVATVDRNALADALTLALWSTPRRPSVPVLAGVLLTAQGDALTVGSFDYEVSSRTTLAADVSADGCALVNVRALRDMVAKFPKVKRARKGEQLPADAGRVTLTGTGDALTVAYGPVRLTLPTMPAEDYPALPDAGSSVAQVDAGTLAATVARVNVAAGTEATLPILTGVAVTIDADGRALLAAIDRYRLAVDALTWAPIVPDGADPREHIPPALIPAATLAHAAKTLGKIGGTVTVGYTPQSGYIGGTVATIAGAVSLTAGPVVITTRCLEGDFPRVRNFLPDAYAGTAQVDARTLADAVERVGMVAERSMPVRLTWAPDGVTVAVGGADGPTASEPVACTSTTVDGFTVGFNHSYLIDGLRTFPAGTAITFGFTTAAKPVVIQADALPAYRYLIMPVRIGGNADVSAAPETPADATDAPVTERKETTVTTTRKPRTRKASAPTAQVEPTPAPAETADVPAQVDDTATVPAPAGELHEPTERAAQVAYERLTEGDYTGARTALADVRAVAPAGYRVAGRFTADDLALTIDAAERAATPAPVAQVEPAPADAPAQVEPTDASDTDTDAETAARVRATLAGATWASDTVHIGRGRERRTMVADVLTLPTGYLPRRVYTAVADVVRSLGGAWNKAARGFVFEPAKTVWNGTAEGARTRSGADALAAWLADAPAQVETPAPTVESAPVPVVFLARSVSVGDRVSVSGVNGNGYPLTVSGHVSAEPVDAGDRGVRIMLSAERDGKARPVYVRDDSAMVRHAPDAPAPVESADTSVAPAPVAPVAQVEPTANDTPAPALSAADAATLADAERATVAAIVAGPFPTGSTVESVHVDPFPVRGTVAGYPAPGRVSVDWHGGNSQVMPVAAVRALTDTPGGPLAFTLAPYAAERGMSYRASRHAVRDALKAAGVRAPVVKSDDDRRVFTVEPVDGADRARVAAIVAGAVALDTDTHATV